MKKKTKEEEAVCCDEEKGVCEPCSFEASINLEGPENE